MKLLPTCREVTDAYARGAYEDAGLLRRLLVQAHLFHCDLCTKYLAQLNLLKEALRRLVAPEPAIAALIVRLKSRL